LICLLASLVFFVGWQLVPNVKIVTHSPQSAEPKVKNVRLKGKKLIVTGENFDQGAVIRLFANLESQRTESDPDSPQTRLIAPKAGKKIPFDEVFGLDVLNPDGECS